MAKRKADTIWILTIWHEYGTNIYPAKTRQAAIAKLHDYVMRWWLVEWDHDKYEEGVPPTAAISGNPEENIEFYFTYMRPDESYAITEEVKILADETIHYSPQETEIAQ